MTDGAVTRRRRYEVGKTLLKIFAGLVGLLVLFAVGVTLYGSTQPEEHVFTRSMQLAQPTEKIFETISDFAAQPSWQPYVHSIEKLADREGKPAWRIVQEGVAMVMTVEESAPPKKLHLHFVDEKQVADIHWEFSLGAITGGSLVLLKERGRINGSFFRGMNRLFGNTKYADQFLQHLAKKYGQNAVIH
jgi:hypothetical protein